LNLVKDSYGNQMSTYYSSSSYDTTKEVYLYSYETYTIEVAAEYDASYIEVRMERDY
jgi:hypothetical protein